MTIEADPKVDRLIAALVATGVLPDGREPAALRAEVVAEVGRLFADPRDRDTALAPCLDLSDRDLRLLLILLRLRLRGESTPHAWLRLLPHLAAEQAKMTDRARVELLFAIADSAGLTRIFDGNEEGARLVDWAREHYPGLEFFGDALDAAPLFTNRLPEVLHLIHNLSAAALVKRDLVEAVLERYGPILSREAERARLRACRVALPDLFSGEGTALVERFAGRDATPADSAPEEPPLGLAGARVVTGSTADAAALLAAFDRLVERTEWQALLSRLLRLLLHAFFVLTFAGSLTPDHLVNALATAGALLPVLAGLFLLFRRRPSTALLAYYTLVSVAVKSLGYAGSDLVFLVLAMVIVVDHHLLPEPPAAALPRLRVARALSAALPPAFVESCAVTLSILPAGGPAWLTADLRLPGRRLTLVADEWAHAAEPGEAAHDEPVRMVRFRFEFSGFGSEVRVTPLPGGILEVEAAEPGRLTLATLRDPFARPDGLAKELVAAVREIISSRQ